MPRQYDRGFSLKLLGLLLGFLLAGTSGCASANHPAGMAALGDDPLPPGIAAATFDSLWSKVSNTYVDTAFVSSRWMEVRSTLRPRADGVTGRRGLHVLLADALGNIPDSHFYIIPAGVATLDSAAETSDGRGTTGLQLRVANDAMVAWRVEPNGAAAHAGIRPGDRIARVAGRDADSALKRIRALPEAGQTRALANTLHGFNGLLTPAPGDTVSVAIRRNSAPLDRRLTAGPAVGRVSQFGNLPPIAGLVRFTRVATAPGGACAGVIAFNIWLPALAPDLEAAVDSARSCEGIVVDLRGNPGGVGAMVMGFGGYFVDSTRSLGTMRTRQVSLNFVINPRTGSLPGPLAILVDPMTASTSEIFAAGMQRLGRARVFGERSAGAALPALMERLPSGDVFVHAVADFTDPRGARIEGEGAVPDEIIPVTTADLVAGRDAPLDAAVRWITSAARARTNLP